MGQYHILMRLSVRFLLIAIFFLISPAILLADMNKYCGEYISDAYGTVTVSEHRDGLKLVYKPKEVSIILRRDEGNKFEASYAGPLPGKAMGFVTFDVNKAGSVEDAFLDVLSRNVYGKFSKTDEPPQKIPFAKKSPKRERLIIIDKEVIRESSTDDSSNNSARKVISRDEKFDEAYSRAKLVDGVRQITYDQLVELRKSGAKFYLVDVLSRADYSTGHIDGAISLPYKKINLYNAINTIPAGSNIVVYCLDYRCPYSTEAARKLAKWGYRVLAYKGGLDEWQEKGHSLVKNYKYRR